MGWNYKLKLEKRLDMQIVDLGFLDKKIDKNKIGQETNFRLQCDIRNV